MLRSKISKPRHHSSWSNRISTSTNNDLKHKANRDFLPIQGKFRVLRRTGTRSNHIIPEFVSSKYNRDHSEHKRGVVVFATVFTVSLLWSLSAMSAVPPSLSELGPGFYSIPAPQVTSVRRHGAMLELVIACFPGEAIITRPSHEKKFFNASMKPYRNLSRAMNEACQRDGRNALGLTLF